MISLVAFWLISILAAIFVRSRWAQWAFFGFVFLFVGLRFETGFDWPAYKYIFDLLQDEPSLERAQRFSQVFQMEIGYVFLTSLAGRVFPEYEFLQAAVSLIFLISVWHLCDFFKTKGFALALTLLSSYLLVSLMFSTVRQCLAVALFNFGLVAAIRGRRILTLALLVTAVSMHVSVLFYVFALGFAFLRPNAMPGISSLLYLTIGGILFTISLPIFTEALPSYLLNRAFAYSITEAVPRISIWQAYLVLMFAFIAYYALFGVQRESSFDRNTTILRRVIVALAIMGICTFGLDVVRDRISYEMFLLFVVLVSKPGIKYGNIARATVMVFGLIFSVFNLLTPLNQIVFTPYQNYIIVKITGEEGNGSSRHELFDRIHDSVF